MKSSRGLATVGALSALASMVAAREQRIAAPDLVISVGHVPRDSSRVTLGRVRGVVSSARDLDFAEWSIMMIKRLVVLVLAAVLPRVVAAQNPLDRMADVRRAIIARDTAKAFALLDTLRTVAPDHPNLAFLRAHANGLAGRNADARAEITRLLRWDARYARAALRDTNVIALRADFVAVDSLARLAERPISLASVWATIAERDLIAEGTAWDASTRSVLVGSLNKHKIIAIAPDGSVTDRVAAGASGLRSVVGIHVDATRGTLWAASNARYDTPTDSTPSALFAFDARTGTFKTRLAV